MRNSLYHIIQLAAFIMAVYTYRRIRIPAMRSLLPFLGFILCSDLVARYQAHFLRLSTIHINYIVAIAELVFYGLFFGKLGSGIGYKNMIRIFIGIGGIAYGYAYMTGGIGYIYFFAAFSLSGFFLTIIAMRYLLIKFTEDTVDLISDPGSWVAFGVALFFSGVSIVFLLYDIIRRHDICLMGDRLYRVVPQLFSMVLYSFISVSLFVCAKKNI